MGGNSDLELLKDGKRLDGRKPKELRPVKMKAGVLERADGSAYVELGGTHAIVGVIGPRIMHPRHLVEPTKAVLRMRYDMMPFSVSDRKRPGPDRRSMEIAKVTRQALESVIPLEKYPKTVIDVFMEILQSDGGTRVTGLTGASLALADAGIEMTDMVASCAAGKIGGEIVLDLCGKEDNFGQADVPVAYAPNEERITMLQMDGLLTKDEFKKAMDYAIYGCKELHKLQKKALKERYKE